MLASAFHSLAFAQAAGCTATNIVDDACYEDQCSGQGTPIDNAQCQTMPIILPPKMMATPLVPILIKTMLATAAVPLNLPCALPTMMAVQLLPIQALQAPAATSLMA